MFKRLFVCVFITIFSASCVLQETLQSPDPVVITQTIAPPKDHTLNAWWSFYNDPVLDRILTSSLSLNPQPNNDKTMSLLSDLIYGYLEYRYIQNQNMWLDDYINATAPDAKEKAVLKDQKAKYSEKLNGLKEKITIQTRLLPEFVDEILRADSPLPTADISPVMASSTSLIDPEPNAFMNASMNRLFGLNDAVFTNPDGLWKIKPGTALNNTNTINPQTREKVQQIERDLIAYTHLREQTRILENALKKHDQFDGAGYYKARLGVLRAHYERVKAVSKIYLSLGVY